MKKFAQIQVLLWLACASITTVSAPASGSEGFDDIAKLVKAGVSNETLVEFVNSSAINYNLSVDEILYLNDLGLPPATINIIAKHSQGQAADPQPVTPVAQAPEQTQPDPTAPATDPVPEIAPLTNTDLDTNEPLVSTDGSTTYTPDMTPNPLDDGTTQDVVGQDVTTPQPVTFDGGDATVSTFYQTLSPYGKWVCIDQTWCWQPTACVTNTNWRPYCDRGHWAWTDDGWCWVSDYAWGWAPFHYGRWCHNHDYGWLWAPDTCWGPAWVSWRECGGYYGWAPLPLAAHFDPGLGFRIGGKHWGIDVGFGLGFNDFCFVDYEHFGEHRLRRHVVDQAHYANVFRTSHVLRDNVATVDGRIVVHGPKFETVEKAADHPLTQLHLADAHGTLGREDHAAGTLNVFRPLIKNTVAQNPKSVVLQQVENQKTFVHTSHDPRVLNNTQRAEELRNRVIATEELQHNTTEHPALRTHEPEFNTNHNTVLNNNNVIHNNTTHVPTYHEAPINNNVSHSPEYHYSAPAPQPTYERNTSSSNQNSNSNSNNNSNDSSNRNHR